MKSYGIFVNWCFKKDYGGFTGFQFIPEIYGMIRFCKFCCKVLKKITGVLRDFSLFQKFTG